jgi:hypothetical protein
MTAAGLIVSVDHPLQTAGRSVSEKSPPEAPGNPDTPLKAAFRSAFICTQILFLRPETGVHKSMNPQGNPHCAPTQ